jgi:hypothetical protein
MPNLMHNDVAIAASAELLGCPILSASSSSAAKYRELSDRLGLDFSSIADVFEKLPIFQEGPAHSATRMALAKIIACGKADRKNNCADYLLSYDLLNTPGEYDLVHDVVRPSVDRYFSDIVGIDLTKFSVGDVPLILSDTIGVRKRVRAEEQIQMLHQALREGFPDEDDNALLLRIVLVVLGHDAMIGATSSSIAHILVDHEMTKLSDIPFPIMFPKTGVPFVHRTALETLVQDDTTLEAGDDITLLLDVFEAPEHEQDRKLFFGHGRHLCLGRSIAIQYWQGVVRKLRSIERTLNIKAFESSTNSVFRTPTIARVTVR